MVGIRPVGIRTLRSFSKNLQFVALYHIFTKSFYFKIKHRSSDERVEADSEGEKHPDPKCQSRFLGGFCEDGEANSQNDIILLIPNSFKTRW